MLPSRLLVARQCAVRAVLGSPAFHANNTFLGPHWRNVACRYYSSAPDAQEQQQVYARPTPQQAALALRRAKMNLLAQQVIDGIHDTKDGALRAFVLNKLKKNSQKKLPKEVNLAIKETITSAGYDEDDVLLMDFQPDMLEYLITTKQKEGWSKQQCYDAINIITAEWPLHKTIFFFGDYYKRHVDVYAEEEERMGGKAREGKIGAKEMGDLIGGSMEGRDYAYMVDLLVKMVIGEGNHSSLLESVKDGRDAAHHFRTIARVYGKVLAHFPKWEFPFMGTVLRELSNVPPKFANHYYSWYTPEMAEDFGSEFLYNTAVEFRKVKKTKLFNPRLIGNENWEQNAKDNFKKKLYTKLDGEDNPLTYYAYKLLRFLRIKQPKQPGQQ